ncbi:unnamed protein product [Moneuplotes crassus]|uniref:Calcium uniporter protein C-terminal domain-containing protein n=1 Tax=Euplotes crassus TaxID=5936 RepID=A0AAD2D0F2_EUPCR|nr:unnamed protein product [Moneuplotes crassus]
MWSRFIFKRQTRRFFSTFSKIQGNSIRLSSTIQTRIKIPINDSQTIDAPIEEGLKQVKILTDENITTDELLKKRFNISVDGNVYHVHPDISTMVTLKHKAKIDEILGEHKYTGVRRVLISMFLDHLLDDLPDKELSRLDIKLAIDRAKKTYSSDKKKEMLGNIKEELKNIDEELSHQYHPLKQMCETRAASYASKMILFGVTMAAGQVGGFAYLIYGVYGWDDIEPVTYLVGAFYAWLSMAFWFRYKEDWEWSSAYDAFYQRKLAKLLRSQSYDEKRVNFLKSYQKMLKRQLDLLES